MKSEDAALSVIEAMLSRGEGAAAERAARALVAEWPNSMFGHVLLGHAFRQRGDLESALASASRAAELAPGHAAPRMLLVDISLERGDIAACTRDLASLASDSREGSAALQHDIAHRLGMLGNHVEAEAFYSRAVALAPGKAAYFYNYGTNLLALGRIADAEAVLDRAIALAPGDSDAWYNRAALRKQTPQRNHIAQIQEQLHKLPARVPGEVPLCYALAKELEDVGEHDRSFAALRRGASARKRALSYRVEDDLETMQLIGDVFDAGFFARPKAGYPDSRPLFVVGLPRSGTTLVDRILSSHSAVASRGETTDVAMAVIDSVGKASSKPELVRRSATVDFVALGAHYCAHLPAGGADLQVDKTPANFLYLGLIAAALPNARIVHLRRNPMDACYAMYKTLFRMGYPFSYDLGDLARYWLGYDRLMAHWRKLLAPECFLEVDYEALVSNQEKVSRELIAHAGLPWEDACLSFERNTTPSLTASAAQVRQPMYRSSIGLWRKYAPGLRPLYEQLRAAGVDVDSQTSEDAP